ncbi:MAG: sulfotransferase [Armatimonadetes bacterium]|nr:sulfotransferase [Armatimonadota bacterium]
MLVTVIGRGHGGTRAMSQTLVESGVYMGGQLNGSYDLVPPGDMYEACRVMARHVVHLGGVRWDFSALDAVPVDAEFARLVDSYLTSVLGSVESRRGWKLPETTLIYPWIVRMFPEAYYIHWSRDPRDSILGAHMTDDLAAFGVSYDPTDDERLRRAISWKYQREIVKATQAPKNTIDVRFEDFVLDQERTLARLERFLGFPLARIEVRPESVGRWQSAEGPTVFDFLQDDMAELGYL